MYVPIDLELTILMYARSMDNGRAIGARVNARIRCISSSKHDIVEVWDVSCLFIHESYSDIKHQQRRRHLLEIVCDRYRLGHDIRDFVKKPSVALSQDATLCIDVLQTCSDLGLQLLFPSPKPSIGSTMRGKLPFEILPSFSGDACRAMAVIAQASVEGF